MESVFDTYRTEPEKAYEIGSGVSIWIAKVGGGTVGKGYHGNWLAQLRDESGGIIHQTHELRSGLPKTHDEMARVYADIIRTRTDIPAEMDDDLTMFAMGMWENE